MTRGQQLWASVLQVIPRNDNKDHVSSRVDDVRQEWSPSHIIPDRWSMASPVGSLRPSRQSDVDVLGGYREIRTEHRDAGRLHHA